jgi:hypothetical protein
MPWRIPWVVGVMSAVVIGSGHIYCGKRTVGLAYLVTAIVLTILIFFIHLFALFLLSVVWEYQIFTAYELAIDYDWNQIFKAEELEQKMRRA